MQANLTKHDMILNEIMAFTGTVVSIAEMKNVSVQDRANAIFLAEGLLHKVMIGYIREAADTALTCSSN